jgi:tRNA (adenine22-N1)-methyltransferase
MDGVLRLSPRQSAVAEMVPRCRVLADIGTERAVLPAFLLLEGRCERAVGVDRSAHVLREAAELLAALELEDRCELRLGDGLAALGETEAQVIVLAGIGGRLIVRLLERDLPRLRSRPRVLVLQPMSEPELLRQWLATTGEERYGVVQLAERLVLDAGRYYNVLVAGDADWAGFSPPAKAAQSRIAGVMGETAAADLGVFLVAGRDPLLPGFIRWRRTSLEHLIEKASAGRSPEGVRKAVSARRLERALARVEALLRDQSL